MRTQAPQTETSHLYLHLLLKILIWKQMGPLHRCACLTVQSCWYLSWYHTGTLCGSRLQSPHFRITHAKIAFSPCCAMCPQRNAQLLSQAFLNVCSLLYFNVIAFFGLFIFKNMIQWIKKMFIFVVEFYPVIKNKIM